MSEINYIDLKEFVEKGFLKEANRKFFHPLGLAIFVKIDWPEGVTEEEKERYNDQPVKHPNAVWSMGDVWDYRDDPEGVLFHTMNKEKADNVENLRASKLLVRQSLGCDENGIQKL